MMDHRALIMAGDTEFISRPQGALHISPIIEQQNEEIIVTLLYSGRKFDPMTLLIIKNQLFVNENTLQGLRGVIRN